ncbi:MAG: FAD-binding protein [Phycisphaerae bacterium]|nr:FAD-binding protein [Phycisphaerae bacterium]
MNNKYETHEHDVIIIGAGGAGLRAAIECSAAGLKTAMICKSLLGKAHTVMAEGGIAASLANVDSQDNWQTHFQDTIFGGKYLNNWRMAELHAREAPERVRELERWGAVFDRTPEGKILQRAFGGHTYKRLAHVGDRTGLELIRTLQDKGIHQGIDVFMECTITRLLKDGERVCGAFGYWRETGRFVVFKAKAIVLSTGGLGRCYKITSNSWEGTGDGHALGFDAGAELLDMEFVQFHPTGMVWPPGVQGLLVTEAVRGEGGMLRNNKGERFMEKYDPKRMELSTRDVVARAIYTEVKEGRGSPHGGCFLDISHRGAAYVKQKLPSMYHQFKELADVDITQEPMEVGPTCHYAMGGLKVTADNGATCVPGLYAAGECTGGMNGANRLGGNSLSDLLVFGRRAGMGAAEYVRRAPAPKVDDAGVENAAAEMTGFFGRPNAEDPYKLHLDLQNAMQSLVGIFREEKDLTAAIAKLEEFRHRAENVGVVEGQRMFNPGWHLCRDLRNMLTCAEAIARAALLRQESRGAHSRIDFPKYDDYWGEHNIVIKKDGQTMKVERCPVVKTAELQPLVDDKKAKEKK